LDVLTKITDIIEPSLNGMGYDLVRVTFQSGTLQIMAERAETGELTIEECSQISHTVSALLDVNDPIKGRYMLEISSPGLDRPLVRLSDFERFTDNQARVELKLPLDGQKRFKGILRGANGANVRLDTEDNGLIELPFADIANARLDIAEQMFADAKGQKKGQKKPNNPSKGKAKPAAKASKAKATASKSKQEKKAS